MAKKTIKKEIADAAYIVTGRYEEVSAFLEELDCYQRRHGICVEPIKQSADPDKFRMAIYYVASEGSVKLSFRKVTNIILRKGKRVKADRPVASKKFMKAPTNYAFIKAKI